MEYCRCEGRQSLCHTVPVRSEYNVCGRSDAYVGVSQGALRTGWDSPAESLDRPLSVAGPGVQARPEKSQDTCQGEQREQRTGGAWGKEGRPSLWGLMGGVAWGYVT